MKRMGGRVGGSGGPPTPTLPQNENIQAGSAHKQSRSRLDKENNPPSPPTKHTQLMRLSKQIHLVHTPNNDIQNKHS